MELNLPPLLLCAGASDREASILSSLPRFVTKPERSKS
jgi:hypothetical protein